MAQQAQVVDLGAHRAKRAGVVFEEPRVRKADVARHFDVCEKTVERWQNPTLYEPPLPKRRSGRRLVRYLMSECAVWHAETFPD